MLLNLRVKPRISGLSFKCECKRWQNSAVQLTINNESFGEWHQKCKSLCLRKNPVCFTTYCKECFNWSRCLLCASRGSTLQVLLAFRGGVFSFHLTEITCKSFLGKRLETAGNLNLREKKSSKVCFGHLKSQREQHLFRWSAAGTCLKTHKTWGQHSLSKPAWFGKAFGRSILGALPLFLGKSRWFHLPLAVKSCCAGGREGAAEAVLDSRFSGSLFNGAPASLNLVYLWLLLCFVSEDVDALWGFLWQNFGSFYYFLPALNSRAAIPAGAAGQAVLSSLLWGVPHWSNCPLKSAWPGLKVFRSLWVIPLCV